MKKLLLILSFLPLISFGQYQTTNLEFLFNGSIEPSDSTLIDSITGLSNSNYKLILVDFDVNLGYLPRKTNAKLAYYQDTIPLTCIFQNMNYADTMFTQILDKELNEDLSELLPYRIKRIAVYSSNTVDVNNFFNTPVKNTVNIREVGIGKTYSDINSAYSAASNGDTIYVYDGYYTVSTVSTYFWIQKTLVIKSVGDGRICGASGSRTVLFVGSGLKVLDGFEIDGVNSTESVVQTFSGSTDNYIKNCYIQNYTITASNDPINIFTDSELFINNCSFLGNNTNYLVRCDGLTNTFTDCHIGGDFGISVYSSASDTTINFEYCNFSLTSGSLIKPTLRTGDYNILYSDASIIDADFELINVSQAGSGVNMYIKNNTFNSNLAGATIITLGGSVYDTISIYNNSFNILNSSQSNSLIVNSNIDCGLNIANNYFDTYQTDVLIDILIVATSNVIGLAEINYNEIHTRAINGYSIRIGTETTSAGDFLIDGGNMIGNKIFGPLYYNESLESVAIHGIFIGFNKNWTIKYNEVVGCGINYVQKSSSGINTSGGFFYNLSKNPYAQSFYSKGHESVKFYNNTSYNDLDNTIYHFYVSENIGSDGANNCDFKNNLVFDSRNNSLNVGIRINTGVTGTISDYNCFYTEGGNFGQDAVSTRTLLAWQSINNLDLNSLNSNPNLDASFTPTNTQIKGKAFDLGDTYKIGLDPSTTIPNNIVLKSQLSSWTAGWKIPNLGRVVNTNARIIYSKGRLILF